MRRSVCAVLPLLHRAQHAPVARAPAARGHRPGHRHPQSQRRDEQGLDVRAGAHAIGRAQGSDYQTRFTSSWTRVAPRCETARRSPSPSWRSWRSHSPPPRRRCNDYAKRTWASFVGDDRPAVRPAGRRPQQRRHHQRPDVDDEHRRVHVERRRRASGSAIISRDELVAAAVADGHDARAHGALRRHGPVLQLVRPPHGREAHRLAAASRAASSTRSSRRSTTAGSRSA